jgi:hypothetical protein
MRRVLPGPHVGLDPCMARPGRDPAPGRWSSSRIDSLPWNNAKRSVKISPSGFEHVAVVAAVSARESGHLPAGRGLRLRPVSSKLPQSQDRLGAFDGSEVTMAVWVVRVGENLVFLAAFEAESVVGIGWSELRDSPLKMTRQQLARTLEATYPDATPAVIANNTGQVRNFINTVALGDLVVVPLKASKHFRVGRIIGPAERRANVPQWVFQANPKRFDLLQALDTRNSETWSANDAPPGRPAR